MYIPAIIFNVIVMIVLIIAFKKNEEKAMDAMRLAWRSFLRLIPLMILLMFMYVLLGNLFTEQFILKYMSTASGVTGYLLGAALGGIIHLPMFIAFPIGGHLLELGVNPGFIAVLVTSLVMVHTFSIPIEVKELGWKFTIARNVLSLIFAIAIGVILGVLY